MTKMINLMPLFLKIDETTSFGESFAADHPLEVTDKGVKARLENDTNVSHLEVVVLAEMDCTKYHKLFDRFSFEDPEIKKLTKKVHDHITKDLGVSHYSGHKAHAGNVIYYLAGLAYGSYLREKYGDGCKMFLGPLKPYQPLDPVSPRTCFWFGSDQGGDGYSDVLAYQHIEKHHYFTTRGGQRDVTGGMAIASIIFRPSGWQRNTIDYEICSPSTIRALWEVIGAETPAALSASS